MPLNQTNYVESRGELFPYNSEYGGQRRVRSNYLFRSADNKEVKVDGVNITFTNAVTLDSNSQTIQNSWPIEIGGNVPTTLNGGDNIWSVTHFRDSNLLTIIIKGDKVVNGDYTLDQQEEDKEIYDAYKADLENILSDTSTSGDGLIENFFGFNWGSINGNDATDVVSEAIEVTTGPSESAASGASRREFRVTIELENNQQFDFYGAQDNWVVLSNDSGTDGDGIIEWKPTLTTNTVIGNLLSCTSAIRLNPPEYIEVMDNVGSVSLGKYLVKDTENDDFILMTERRDGQDFPSGTFSNCKISSINLQPRLRVKYKLPDPSDPTPDPPQETETYRFYSQPSGIGYKNLATNSSIDANQKIEIDGPPDPSAVPNNTTFLDGRDADATSDPPTTPITEIFGVGASRTINGLNFGGNLPFGVKTQTEDLSSAGGPVRSRKTPWRKGYRAINRFTPKEATIRKVQTSSGVDGYMRANLTLSVAQSNQDNLSINTPEAILHKPILCQWDSTVSGSHGKNQICFGATPFKNSDGTEILDLLSSADSFGGANTPSAKFFMRSGPAHTLEREDHIGNSTNGYVLESSNPNTITFFADMADADTRSLGTRPPYDFTGKVSTRYGVIPAYSGEILAADNDMGNQETPDFGFIEFNYTNTTDLSLIDKFAVFIDISETDEVLRWNGLNYDPLEMWKGTFASLKVTNVTKGTSVSIPNTNCVMKKDSKTNYVVVMHTDMGNASGFVIDTDDKITVEFLNKKVLRDFDTNAIPSDPTTVYVPIEYRPLEKEGMDDIFFTKAESRLSDFTISSDGTVDGNITINYDGDVPDGTQFRLFIEEDEEGSP